MSAEIKSTLSQLEEAAPQFLQLSQRLTDLYWQKEADRVALGHELRELEQMPPGREEGAAFFNEFLSEMEALSVERLRDAIAAFSRNREVIGEQGRIKAVATNALDSSYRRELGIDAFLIGAMRGAIPDLLDKINWPVNTMTDTARIARMEKLRTEMEILSTEKAAIGEKLAVFGIVPKRPD